MNVLVLDATTRRIPVPDLDRVVNAIQRQMVEHYAALWEAAPMSVHRVDALPSTLGISDWPLTLLDNPPDPSEGGFHSVDDTGRPLLRVFAEIYFQNGGTLYTGAVSVSGAMSHEILEANADPYVNTWVDNWADGLQYAAEIADPGENDSYEIDGVAVSNFVGPRWFRAGAGPFDWMGRAQGPFDWSRGYVVRRSPGGDPTAVFGDRVADWKKAAVVGGPRFATRRGAR